MAHEHDQARSVVDLAVTSTGSAERMDRMTRLPSLEIVQELERSPYSEASQANLIKREHDQSSLGTNEAKVPPSALYWRMVQVSPHPFTVKAKVGLSPVP